jgi:hypothetical protein
LRSFVNNVRQNVSSYSVSGYQLTLGGTISASDECWVLFLGRTVGTKTPAVGSVTNDMLAGSIATSKLADGSTFATTNGITEADQWRVTANFSNSVNGADEVITSNWERADTSDFEKIGTGLTESSGTFSFPSTGKYYINAHAWFYPSSASSGFHFKIFVTTDNSSYTTRSLSISGTSGTDRPHNMAFSTIIDVTDISNVKFRIVTNGGTYVTWQGSSTYQSIGFNCIRLGDT